MNDTVVTIINGNLLHRIEYFQDRLDVLQSLVGEAEEELAMAEDRYLKFQEDEKKVGHTLG